MKNDLLQYGGVTYLLHYVSFYFSYSYISDFSLSLASYNFFYDNVETNMNIIQ